VFDPLAGRSDRDSREPDWAAAGTDSLKLD